ncbi:MAG: type II secretion system protein, partial [Planctomycetes bacterium]|nr:type II secretion system protein [Planctomycetota bacterium]
MVKNCSKRPGARPMSLVELLVVSAILAILASMLMPSLSRMLEQGRRVSCLNQKKQLDIITFSYCDDSADFFPHPIDGYSPDGPKASTRNWQDWNLFSNYGICQSKANPLGTLAATGYLEDWSLLFCPSLVLDRSSPYAKTQQSNLVWYYDSPDIYIDNFMKQKYLETGAPSGSVRSMSAGVAEHFYPYATGPVCDIGYTKYNMSRLRFFTEYWYRKPPGIWHHNKPHPERGFISPALFSCLNLAYAGPPYAAVSHDMAGLNCAMVDGSARWVSAEEVYDSSSSATWESVFCNSYPYAGAF